MPEISVVGIGDNKDTTIGPRIVEKPKKAKKVTKKTAKKVTKKKKRRK